MSNTTKQMAKATEVLLATGTHDAKTSNDSEETQSQKRKRLKEEARQREKVESEKKECERLAGIPTRLFYLQVQIAQLSQNGVDIAAYVSLRDRNDRSNEKPGLHVRIAHSNEFYLTLESEDWEFECVTDAINSELERIEQEKRDRALAEGVKARLQPDELAALKKYG